MTTTPNPTAEKVIADAITAYWADEERSGPNRGPEAHDRECGIDAANALRAHGLLSEGAPTECSNPACPLRRAHSGPCAPEGWSPDREKLIAAEKKLTQIEKYANDRAAHMRHPILNTVGSGRIASDLFEILGLDWPEDDEFPDGAFGLDPVKVAEVLKIAKRSWHDMGGGPSLVEHITDALCEAYMEGKLTK